MHDQVTNISDQNVILCQEKNAFYALVWFFLRHMYLGDKQDGGEVADWNDIRAQEFS